jgi:hypothetical protein
MLLRASSRAKQSTLASSSSVAWDADEYTETAVQWRGATLSTFDDHKEIFDIPMFPSFTWDSCNHTETVSGESKEEYQHKLSETMRLKGGSGGFGMEMNESFNETDFSETYKKYASVYEIQQVYTLKVNETDTTKLQKHLTPHALEVFREKTPSDIVDIFGTHYMTQAGFGGLKRMLSVLDIREENVSTDFAI